MRKKGFNLRDRFNRITIAVWVALTVALAVGLHFYEVKTTDHSNLSPLEYKQMMDAHRIDDFSVGRVITYAAFGSLVIFMATNAVMGAVRRASTRNKT